ESQLSWNFCHVLALAQRCRRRAEPRGARHSFLREGRAQPDHTRRSCEPGVPLQRRRRLRRRVMQQYFFDLAQDSFATLAANEIANIYFSGESSSFARFNRAKLRQPGDVEQRFAKLTLIR